MGSIGSREVAADKPDEEDVDAACKPPPRLVLRADKRPLACGIRRTVRTPLTCSSYLVC